MISSGMPGRLSGLYGDLGEDGVKAEMPENILHVVMIAHGRAADWDKDIRVTRVFYAASDIGWVIPCCTEIDGLCSPVADQRLQCIFVGGYDLSGLQVGAGRFQFVAIGQ